MSGEGGTSAEKNSGCGGRPDGMVAGGILDAICPDGMTAEEFRMRYVRMEWRRENSGCDMPDRMLAEENFQMRDARIECWRRRISGCGGCPGGMGGGRNSGCDVSEWNGGGGIPDAICPGGMAAGGIPDAIYPDGMNVVMSSMKVRYGLYGHGGLGEWF